MTLDFDEDRKSGMRRALQAWFASEMDEDLSDFRADALLDTVLNIVGPEVYNQAVRDVRAHLQAKLDDLDGEIYLD